MWLTTQVSGEKRSRRRLQGVDTCVSCGSMTQWQTTTALPVAESATELGACVGERQGRRPGQM